MYHPDLASVPDTHWPDDALEQPLFTRFADMATRYAEHAALLDGQRLTTYAHLLAESLHLARRLASYHADVIGILLPMNQHCLTAMLASLHQGIPYIPLDRQQSALQWQRIIAGSTMNVLVTDTDTARTLGPDLPPELRIVCVDQPDNVSLGAPIAMNAHADSIACILYTSGTTGDPKGVYQNQRILMHDVSQYSKTIRLSSHDTLSWIYPPNVIGAIRDIFGALLNGATLVSMNARNLGLRGLIDEIWQRRVTVLHIIPPLLRALLSTPPDPAQFGSIRLLYTAGDRLFASDVQASFSVLPNRALIYNGMGATECTTLHHHWFISHDTEFDSEHVPVGYPVDNKTISLIPPKNNGSTSHGYGEIAVTSAYIALGYWRNPTLTAERFSYVAGNRLERTYHTGDLAIQLPDGRLQFVGRVDGLVKIRGYRVNPIEVEMTLRGLKGVSNAAVFTGGDAPTPTLAAAVVGTIPPSECRQHLARSLPEWAIPTQWLWLDALPQLSNYKTDTQALRARLPHAVENTTTNPDTVESAIVACWCETLSLAKIDKNLSFAEAGGDSLAALRVLARLEQILGRALPLDTLTPDRSLQELLTNLKESHAVTDNRPTLFIIPTPGGISHLHVFSAAVARQMRIQLVPLPSFSLPRSASLSISESSVMIADFIMREAGNRPIHMAGISAGARGCYQAACLLEQRGVRISTVIAGDLGPAYVKPAPKMQARLINALDPAEWIKRLCWRLPLRLIAQSPMHWQDRIGAWLSKALGHKLGYRAETHLLNLAAVYHAKHWHPPRLKGTLHVLRAAQDTRDLPADLGWGEYASDIRIHWYEGGHNDIFQPSNHQLLASLLRSEPNGQLQISSPTL